MTFDVKAQVYIGIEFGWASCYEIFCVCRNCNRPTIFVVKLTESRIKAAFDMQDALVSHPQSLNPYFEVVRFVSLKDNVSVKPPEHIPTDIEAAFREAATCLGVECFNAAGAMFRLCVDLATRPLLPDKGDTSAAQPSEKERRDLGLRLKWLFDNGHLPTALRELAKCIREDGNDGAHVGSLTKPDAEDLLDFTTSILERLFTEPKRLELAESRRAARRAPPT